ncbi:MAG: hypothetical protein AB1689_22755 [Thermodesulfobacteriota bacterium]
MTIQVEQTIQQVEAIFRFNQEVDRRFAECGIGSTGELLQIYGQLRQAVERLSFPELEWASQEAGRLHQRLRELGEELQHLSTLKAAFEVRH